MNIGSSTPQIYSGVPLGTIIIWAGIWSEPGTFDDPNQLYNPANDGWIVCDGRTLPVGQFFGLWKVLGKRYSTSATEENMFSIPDYRGYFLRAVDDRQEIDKRLDPGKREFQGKESVEVGSVENCAIQTHTHTYTQPAQPSAINTGDKGGMAVLSVSQVDTSAPFVTTSKKEDPKLVSEKETRPINIAVYYLIKAF